MEEIDVNVGGVYGATYSVAIGSAVGAGVDARVINHTPPTIRISTITSKVQPIAVSRDDFTCVPQ
jgi:hypothetical protein